MKDDLDTLKSLLELTRKKRNGLQVLRNRKFLDR